jgi:hypothetical protein
VGLLQVSKSIIMKRLEKLGFTQVLLASFYNKNSSTGPSKGYFVNLEIEKEADNPIYFLICAILSKN